MEEGALLSLTGVIGVKHAGSSRLLRRRHVSRFLRLNATGSVGSCFWRRTSGGTFSLGFCLGFGFAMRRRSGLYLLILLCLTFGISIFGRGCTRDLCFRITTLGIRGCWSACYLGISCAGISIRGL